MPKEISIIEAHLEVNVISRIALHDRWHIEVRFDVQAHDAIAHLGTVATLVEVVGCYTAEADGELGLAVEAI